MAAADEREAPADQIPAGHPLRLAARCRGRTSGDEPAANIAVQHLADMQSQPEAHVLGDSEVGDCGPRHERGGQTGGAKGGDAGIITDREDREQAVADEFNTSPPRSRIAGIWQSK
jgi:hypothetical protein